LAQSLQPGFHGVRVIQVCREQRPHPLVAQTLGTPQQRLQILDPIPPPQQKRPGLLQVDQAGLPASFLFTQENMFGIKTAMHLPDLMERACQFTNRADDGRTARFVQLRPPSQAAVEILPAIQRPRQQDRPLLTCNLAAAKKACL